MNRVEQIESELQQLSTDELRSFREWFARFDAEAWDQQLESDIAKGKLDKLAERALRDYKAGKATEL